MTVSQVALGVMLFSCFFSGVVLATMYDMLLIPRTLFCSTWGPWVLSLRRRLSLPTALQPWRRLERYQRPRQEKQKKAIKWRRIWPFVLTAVADFLFCVIAATVLLLLLYATNDGAFRISAAVAMLMGVLLGRMTLARWMTLMAQTLYTVLRSGIIFMLAVIAYPITAFSVFLWLRSASKRQHLLDKYQQKKQERQQRREAKRQAANVPAVEQEIVAARPQPDGRRVFCAGRAR